MDDVALAEATREAIAARLLDVVIRQKDTRREIGALVRMYREDQYPDLAKATGLELATIRRYARYDYRTD